MVETEGPLNRIPVDRHPVLVFGAFDRHNLGDLLLARLARARLGDRPVVFAGLAARDLRRWGGPCAVAVHAPDLPRVGAVVQAGGEVLTCTAREAATMLLAPESVDATLSALEAAPESEAAWRLALLRTGAEMPYVLGPGDLPGDPPRYLLGVGGVELAGLPADARRQVLARLREARGLGVRDQVTQSLLRSEGLDAELMPDAVAGLRAVLGGAIRRRARRGAVAALRARFPQGFVAVQLHGDAGDDATLDRLAAALRPVLQARRLGLVGLRCGIAPWHDDARTMASLARRWPARRMAVLESVHALEVCALLASARAVVATSLHAGIVARAFAVPATGLLARPASGQALKLRAYADTWSRDLPGAVATLDELPAALDAALGSRARLREAWAHAHARCWSAAADQLLSPLIGKFSLVKARVARAQPPGRSS